MKLTIPFNGQTDLLERVNKEKVVEIYGKLSQDFIGGARSSSVSPFVYSENLISCIKKAHKYGIKFKYLLNATCLGNREWTRSGQKRVRSLLDWLDKIEVDSLSVSIPYLAQIIKKCYPKFEISVSNTAEIRSIKTAREWEDLGVDEISFHVDINRNFPLLKALRRDLKCRIEIIANQDTLFNCPYYNYHVLGCSHASQSKRQIFYIDYCRLSCSLKRIKEPLNLISADWIRPEDMRHYEDIGIDRLKLVDRSMITDAIVRVVDAYTRGRYEGNLLDLMAHPSVNLLASKPNLLKKIKYFFRPFTVNVFKLYKAKEVMGDLDVYIDNRSLDGFIDFFLKNNCDLMSCDECGYCNEVAKKVVKINPAHQENACRLHRIFLDELVSGDMFRY